MMASNAVEYPPSAVGEQNTFSTIPPSKWSQSGNDELAEPKPDTFVSNQVVYVFEVAVLTILCGVISAFGLVANVINVLVFFRQGALSSSSNVSLLALAFADIGASVPVLCNSVNYVLFYLGVDSIFLTPSDFMDTVAVWPHIMCMQIASMITAYIAFERCLCVVFPLKVKSLFSAKRSIVVTTTIASVVIVSFLPTFATHKVLKIFDSSTNATGIVFFPTELHFEVMEASDVAHAFILRPLSLFIVFVCTQITIFRIELSSSWRKSITTMSASASSATTTITTTEAANINENNSKELSEKAQDQRNVATTMENSTSTTPRTGGKTASRTQTSAVSKEARLVKMIAIISAIFMVCNTPDILGVFVLMTLQTTLQLSQWDNIFRLFISTQLCLESINSAINIFVYYRMSTAYRQAFRTLMGKQ